MTIQSEIQALKCADCARSDSAVSDLRPDSLLPIPADALSGWSDGRPGSGVTRRKLLRNGVLGFAAVYGATQLSFEQVWEAAVAQAAEPMQRSIVVVYLNGGNDGLNCFVPASAPEYAKYQALRPTIARVLGRRHGRVRRLDDHARHRRLAGVRQQARVRRDAPTSNGDTKGFDTLYGDGTGGPGSDLAIIPAADYNPPNRSHFESRDYWFAGALAQLQTGWLGRWLDTYGSQTNPLQAVSLDSNLSKQIRSLEGARVRPRRTAGRGLRRAGRRPATSTPRSASSRPCRRGRQRRARPLARHDGPHGRRRRTASRASTAACPASAIRPTAASRRSCSSRRRCSRPVSARA